MTDQQMITRALSAWASEQSEDERHNPAGSHLADTALYRLAAAGGLEDASDEEREHLALCPSCLAAWASWCDSLEIVAGEAETSEARCGIGLLKAASASLFQEPLSLLSTCGRFELSVYPEREEGRRGLVTLEVLDAADSEGRCCEVRDGAGTILLQGIIEEGRVAGRIDDLAALDLKTWTVFIGGG